MARTSDRCFAPGIKLWITNDRREGVFGEGKFRLLHDVELCGSLRQAAAANNISYRKAWGDIRKAEERLNVPLLRRERGGSGGGSSTITPQAAALLEAYGRFRDEVVRYARRQFALRLRRIMI
ncbi:MAG: LysR family transcriptional regulator [Planctomycetota bacterium]